MQKRSCCIGACLRDCELCDVTAHGVHSSKDIFTMRGRGRGASRKLTPVPFWNTSAGNTIFSLNVWILLSSQDCQVLWIIGHLRGNVDDDAFCGRLEELTSAMSTLPADKTIQIQTWSEQLRTSKSHWFLWAGAQPSVSPTENNRLQNAELCVNCAFKYQYSVFSYRPKALHNTLSWESLQQLCQRGQYLYLCFEGGKEWGRQ